MRLKTSFWTLTSKSRSIKKRRANQQSSLLLLWISPWQMRGYYHPETKLWTVLAVVNVNLLTVHVMRNTYRNYQSLPCGTSRELSVTPVGYFTGAISHSCGVLHGSCQSLLWGISRELSVTPMGTSRELSVTPVGYFTGAISHSHGYFTRAVSHSCGVLHGSYQSLPWVLHERCQSLLWGTSRELSVTPAWRKWGISEQHDFPKVTLALDGIWRHMGALFCNWNWIKWFRWLLLFFNFLRVVFTMSLRFFCRRLRHDRDRACFLASTDTWHSTDSFDKNLSQTINIFHQWVSVDVFLPYRLRQRSFL
jgi:hypothetical protein